MECMLESKLCSAEGSVLVTKRGLTKLQGNHRMKFHKASLKGYPLHKNRCLSDLR